MTVSTGFIHTVLFYTNSADDAQKVAAGCKKHLADIPFVKRFSVGFPAGTPRDVVDNSYGTLLLIEFDDAAGCAAYDTHPDHQAFIAENKEFWTRVQVYDAVISG